MASENTGIGEYLRKTREAQGKTLAEIAEETKINPRYLEALEREAWGELPAEVFTQGYLRAYALALGLDPEKLLERYAAMRPPQEDPLEVSPLRRKILALPWLGVILAFLLLFFFLLWLFH
ncbi:MAG: hypothetical protein DSZ24_04030 [Thermodesulfatator sp.]|nr:MAG: hypothetical protein DSZ24_04030 [Thermodesulfatator sp.]